MGVKDKKGSTQNSQVEDKAEPTEALKSDPDNKKSENKKSVKNSQVEDKAVTSIKKPDGVIRLEKKDIYFLPNTPSGKSSTSVGIYCEEEKRDVPFNLSLENGRYKIDKKKIPDNLSLESFITILGDFGFKPVFDKVAYEKVDEKVANIDKAFKLVHPDYAMNSHNYTGEYKIEVSGKNEIVKINNGICVVNNSEIKDALVFAGFTSIL